MNKGILIGTLGVAFLGAVALTGGVLASRGDMRGGFGPNYSPERHAQMTDAFSNGDYNSWKSLMGDRGAAKFVTEENFSKFTRMHELMLAGKTAEADVIRQELGMGRGQKGGMMGGRRGQNAKGSFVDRNGDGTCDHMQR